MTDIIEVIDDGTIVAVVEQAAAVVIEVPQDDAPTVVEIHVPGPRGPAGPAGPGSSVEIGGDDTQVQFNYEGLLFGDPTFVFDKDNDRLRVHNLAAERATIISAGDISGLGDRAEHLTQQSRFYSGDGARDGVFGLFGFSHGFTDTDTGESFTVGGYAGAIHFDHVDVSSGSAGLLLTPDWAAFAGGSYSLVVPFKNGTFALIEDIAEAVDALETAIEIGGDDTQVQFNDGGLLAGDPTFTFDKDSKELAANVVVTSQVYFPLPVPEITMLEVADMELDDPASHWTFTAPVTYGDSYFTVDGDGGNPPGTWPPVAHINAYTTPITAFVPGTATFRAFGSRTGDAEMNFRIGYGPVTPMTYAAGIWEGSVAHAYASASVFSLSAYATTGDITLERWEVEMAEQPLSPIIVGQAAGQLVAHMPTVTQAETKVLVVADSQTVGGTIDFGDTVLHCGDIYVYSSAGNGCYMGSQRVQAAATNIVGDVTEYSSSYFGPQDYGFITRATAYNNDTQTYESFARAALNPSRLSFATYTSDITIVPNGDMVGSINVEWPAESGTIALVEDLTAAIVVGTPSSSAGVLTLDFAGKSRAVFEVVLTEDITSTVIINKPAGVFLEYEVHYRQDNIGGRTITLPNYHGALGGSDTQVGPEPFKVSVLSASSVDGGTTWRYAMQESVNVSVPE